MPDTPYLWIDGEKMDRNIRRMAEMAASHGVQLRPHAKTHKIPEIAHRQIAAGSPGITVAKPAEAEVMAEQGVADIFIAYPIIGSSKIERVLQLSRKIRLVVGVDSLEGARSMAEHAARLGQTMEVRLEVDTGLRRTGVLYEDAIKLAREISQLESLRLTGIYTFRGALLQGKSTLDLHAAGLEEGALMVSLAEEIRAQGIAIRDISVGSTPTASHVAAVKGITEIRPGTYVFGDRMQAKLGVCELEDCAARVIATVVSRPADDLMIIDGGSKTFATDVQPNVPPLNLQGFACSLEYPDILLERLTEEHGMVRIRPEHRFAVGDTVAFIPNHICSTINLHNKVYLAEGGSVRELPVAARGMLD